MTSRLERLFLLLETGQSGFLRKSAAYQIGDIVKTHPNELGQLIDKLKPLVINLSWETRIAASQTVEAIMKNLNENELISEFFNVEGEESDGASLDGFNLAELLRKNPILLSSDTQKYDAKDQDTNSSCSSTTSTSAAAAAASSQQINEKLKQQRHLLNLKLGIDVGGAAKLDTTHIFSDYDIISSADPDNEAELTTSESSTSVRGKRRLAEATSSTSIDMKSEPTLGNEENTKKKIKTEQTVDSPPTESEETKTAYIKHLHSFTEWLFGKLFNPEWEHRHGAASCLREIIKKLVQSLLASDAKGSAWFESCLCKLFQVIALDRFADYIGDETVAPVRETCTQTIGIISKLYTKSSIDVQRLCLVINMFLAKEINQWEISHSGIMILKYTIAAASSSSSNTRLNQIITLTFPNIIKCIQDTDDDVRQVASSSLEPISTRLNSILADSPSNIELLIRTLIDVLSDLDDLGTSCSSVMSLLSDLLTLESNRTVFIRLLNGESILPRLMPFLSHSSTSVRQTTMSTIDKIVRAINAGGAFKFEELEKHEDLATLMRLLYQQAILMSSDAGFKLLEPCLTDLWTTLCEQLSPKCLIAVCFPFITTWLVLMMYPSNQAIESVCLVPTTSESASNSSKEYLGSNLIRFEEKTARDSIQIKCRLLAAKLLSVLFDRLSKITEQQAAEKPFEQILAYLCTQINFKSGLQRFCLSLLCISMCQVAEASKHDEAVASLQKSLAPKLIASLDDENTIYFDEIAHMFTRLQKEVRFLLTNYQRSLTNTLGLNLAEMSTRNVFTFEDITSFVDKAQEKLALPNVQILLEGKNHEAKMLAEIRLLVSNLAESNKQASGEQEQLQLRSLFALSSACIRMGTLCERMNPMIRPLIECIRFETNADLQAIASHHLALLLQTCARRHPNPIPKIFKNLLSYLCNDHSRTPLIQSQPHISTLPDKEFYEINRYYGILSDSNAINESSSESSSSNNSNNSGGGVPSSAHSVTTPHTPNTPNNRPFKKRNSSVNGVGAAEAAAAAIAAAGPMTPSNPGTPGLGSASSNGSGSGSGGGTQLQPDKNQVEKRGAEFAFKSVVVVYNSLEKLLTIVPELVNQPLAQIKLINDMVHANSTALNSDELTQILRLDVETNLNKYQELVSCLCLVDYLCTIDELSPCIMKKYLDQVPELMRFVKLPLTSVRYVTNRCLASICRREVIATMQVLLEYTIECLENSEFNLFARQGAIELMHCLLESLGHDVIPFIVIFIVPILRRMCDIDWYVRSTASQCFATLVKLYPLSSAASTDRTSLDEIAERNANIRRMREEQQGFLDQLMDQRKLKSYDLPNGVFINVKLRPYQQSGVDWLAFLKKFNLHGILCDDMGLGKTLQSICILAGDHHEKQTHHHNTHLDEADFDDSKFTPSIIICPTTLTNHWHHEIDRFVDTKCLRPFIYSGTIAERENLRRIFFQNTGRKPNQQRPNVFIVSYDIVRHDIQHVCTQKWNYCILDEGHLIKSSKSKLSKAIKQIRAAHRLILTGTPIQNNVIELWCLFDFLLPGYLGTEKQFHLKYARFIAPQSASFQHKLERVLSQQHQEKFGTKQFQASSSSNSDKKQGNGPGEVANAGFHQMSILALESLHKQVLPFLLRRTKEEVLNDLPPKIIQDYYCEMSPLQIELYQDFAKSNVSDTVKRSLGLIEGGEEDEETAKQEEENIKSKPQSSEHVFQALQYLRKVVNHPSLVLKPDHPKWDKIRSEMASSSMTDVRHSGKLLALRDLLMECGIGSDDSSGERDLDTQSGVLNQHRVLIFCQLKSMIDIIENELLRKMHNVSFLRLDGTVAPSERFGIVKKFNSDPSIDILLLTTQIGGLGLNLTGADTVIFVEHDWNPQKDLQAMDRAHRIGQTRVVNVYRLITKQTIEEKIMSLQRFKLGIANSVVNIENSSLASMGTEQIMNMFDRETSSSTKTTTTATTTTNTSTGSGYQRLLENIGEIWDESQYENEYNLDNFIKSLK